MKYERIRALREDKDLRQTQMEKFCLAVNVYTAIMSVESLISTDILIKLADFHNVSVDYLLNRTEDPAFHKKTK